MIEKSNEEESSSDKVEKKRCSKCPRSKDRKTDKVCSRCENYFCLSCCISFIMCRDCFNSIKNDNKAYQIEKSDFPARYLRSRSKK